MTYLIHKLHESEDRLACGLAPDLFPSVTTWQKTTCPDCLALVGKLKRKRKAVMVEGGRRDKQWRLTGKITLGRVGYIDRSLVRKFGKEPKRMKFSDWRGIVPFR